MELIDKYRYFNVISLTPEILDMCNNEKGCFLSKNKKKILFTNPDFLHYIKENYTAKLDHRAEDFSLRYWYNNRFANKTDKFFDISINFDQECINGALQQIDDICEDGGFDYDDWEGVLDYIIKSMNITCIFDSVTKDYFLKFNKEVIEEELDRMRRKNYDTSVIEEILNG